MVARITGSMERIDLAESAAETVLSSPFSEPVHAVLARAGLGLSSVLKGEVQSAQQHYIALESYRGLLPAGLNSLDRLLGLLSHTMGNLDQAAVHFEDAIAFCRRANFRPEAAWTCCDYADALLQRNQSGDKEKAMTMLDESLAISSELGMRPLMERVLSRREILKA